MRKREKRTEEKEKREQRDKREKLQRKERKGDDVMETCTPAKLDRTNNCATTNTEIPAFCVIKGMRA